MAPLSKKNVTVYTELVPGRLYIGTDEAPRQLRADLHIACAEECLPDPLDAGRTIHLKLDDDSSVDWLTRKYWPEWVLTVAHEAARNVKRGKVVLITCHLGLNRSGLVTALTLCDLGMTPDEAIQALRGLRSKDALCNHAFVDAIRRLA